MNFIERMKDTRMNSPMLSGMVYAMIAMVCLTVLLSLLLLMTDLKESAMSIYVYSIHGVSLLIGGFVAGKRAYTKGWFNGGMIGFIYSLIILLVGYLGFDASFSLETLGTIGGSFLVGAFGGIMGVNTRK
jgi:putative membrane protein (TIGR04086 family)